MTSRHREAIKGQAQCLGSRRWRAQPSTHQPLKVGGLRSHCSEVDSPLTQLCASTEPSPALLAMRQGLGHMRGSSRKKFTIHCFCSPKILPVVRKWLFAMVTAGQSRVSVNTTLIWEGVHSREGTHKPLPTCQFSGFHHKPLLHQVLFSLLQQVRSLAHHHSERFCAARS